MQTATNPVQVLRNEEQKIDKQILDLQEKKEALANARTVFETKSSGFGLYRNQSRAAYPKKTTKKSTPKKASPKKRMKKASGPQQLTIKGVKNAKPRAITTSLSTMDMARTVLQNGGREMTPGEIHQGITETFGKTPAATLTQMLYKRSRANSSFYRGAKGYYGLLVWKQAGQKAA